MRPHKILMIKSHSIGIGDILRSSAAWRALKNQWPEVELHLLFLSKHEKYASENLIRAHHLLSSAHFITVRDKDPSVKQAKRKSFLQLFRESSQLIQHIQPDLIIDFEPHGLKSSLLTWTLGKIYKIQTLGVGQFPGRSLFYNLASVDFKQFANKNSLTLPMDYSNRDFVVLDALHIQRQNSPIELKPGDQAIQFKNELSLAYPQRKMWVGLNIGCATDGAEIRRPDLQQLALSMIELQHAMPHTLILTGAPFEAHINEEFKKILADMHMDMQQVLDFSGKTSIETLPGLIDSCDLFISSDSGPYHMAVALKKPTFAWFNFKEPAAQHKHPWVAGMVQPTSAEFIAAIQQLMSSQI